MLRISISGPKGTDEGATELAHRVAEHLSHQGFHIHRVRGPNPTHTEYILAGVRAGLMKNFAEDTERCGTPGLGNGACVELEVKEEPERGFEAVETRFGDLLRRNSYVRS